MYFYKPNIHLLLLPFDPSLMIRFYIRFDYNSLTKLYILLVLIKLFMIITKNGLDVCNIINKGKDHIKMALPLLSHYITQKLLLKTILR